MKLEFKHLVPYLPYELGGVIKEEYSGIRLQDSDIFVVEKWDGTQLGAYNRWCGIYSFMPFLRPLSSITEAECIELCKLLTKGKDCEFEEVDPTWMSERVVFGFDEGENFFFYYIDKGNKRGSLELTIEDGAFSIGIYRGSYPNCNDLNHIDLMDWLYKNHFDVFRLIPEGLAICIKSKED